MRVRAAQDRGVEHVRQDDVVGVLGRPRHSLVGVDPGHGLANQPRFTGPGLQFLLTLRALRDDRRRCEIVFHAGPPVVFRSSAALAAALKMCLYGRAAAQIAADSQPNLLEGGIGILPQQALNGHDLARRAKSALEGVLLGEGLLDRTELLAVHQAFERGDLVALGLHRERHAGVARSPVDEDGAGAALAALATHLGRHQSKRVAQDVEQAPARFHLDLARSAVHLQHQDHGLTGGLDLLLRSRLGGLDGCSDDRSRADRRDESPAAHASRVLAVLVFGFFGHCEALRDLLDR